MASKKILVTENWRYKQMTNFMISGHITKDAVTRQVNFDGKIAQVTEFTVASNDGWDSTTKKPRFTNFWKVSVWRDRGVNAAPYLTKGRRVNVKGVPTGSGWIGEDGKARCTLEVKDADFELCEKKAGDPEGLPFAPEAEEA
jgi:single stranded DNA-binding protein